MKKTFILLFSLVLCSLVLLTSCGGNENKTTGKAESTSKADGETTTELIEDEVNMKIFGYVVDEYNNPVAGATVTVGEEKALTDDDGSYTLLAPRQSAFDIVAKKDGYFEGEAKDLDEAKIKANANLLNVQINKKHIVQGKVFDGSSPKGTSFNYAEGANVFIETDKKYEAKVNADGTYTLEFAALPFTKRAVMFFEYKGYANTYLFVSVAKAASAAGAKADITVMPNTYFSGTVTLGGNPVRNAVIKIQPKIDYSAAANGAKTIETIIYTDKDGKYKSSDKSLICYASEYNVILEYRDLFGNAVNDKGDKITQVPKTVKVSELPDKNVREFVVDFILD